ncbi:MAG: class I SAM-dependent methyltransferase [Candidatus Methylomirabilia bacterium]
MTKQKLSIACPLCNNGTTKPFHRDRKRDYFHCPHCDLVFVPPDFHLAPEKERARYDCHQNSLSDPGYRAFLNRLFKPLKERLRPGARGLDFGCGRTPTLSVLFAEAGYACADYDRHYANDPAVLEKKYDFLACSETMEHFTRPREEFERFLRLVKPGGWLGIMTQLRDEAPPFEKWFYKDDATHVCFFSRRTFQALASCAASGGGANDLHVEFHRGGVVLIQATA